MNYYPEQFEAFVNGYVTALLFAESVETDESDEVYLDSLVSGIEDFSPEAAHNTRKDCRDFIVKVQREGIPLAYDNLEQAGMDFYYTRNGHGVGFWDRPEIYGKAEAEKLTKIAKSFPEIYVSFDQDENKVHID